MLQYILDGADTHALTASEFFHRDLKEYKKPRTEEATHERDLAKNLGFGLCYGLGIKKLSWMYNISTSEAEHFKEFYFNKYHDIWAYRERYNSEVSRCGYAETLCGRRRYLPRDRVYTQAVNTVIQGTGADVLKYSMVDVFEFLNEMDTSWTDTGWTDILIHRPSRLVLPVHDSIMLYVHESELFTVVPQVVDLMQKPRFQIKGTSVPLLVEVARGRDWSDMHEVESVYQSELFEEI